MNGTRGPMVYMDAPALSGGGSGYMDVESFGAVLGQVRGLMLNNFGGAMLWGGSEGLLNVVDGSITFRAQSRPWPCRDYAEYCPIVSSDVFDGLNWSAYHSPSCIHDGAI
jgi:hypothetical protein